MSTQLQYSLPDDPPAGVTIEIVPLGGDGMSAPQSAYSVKAELAGDSSNGFIGIEVAFDPQYCALVQYLSWSWKPFTGSADQSGHVRAAVRNRKDGEVAQQNFYQGYFTGSGSSGEIVDTFGHNGTWNPPGILATYDRTISSFSDKPRLSVQCPNQGTSDELVLTARILNFDRRARELTPLSVLLASLPR